MQCEVPDPDEIDLWVHNTRALYVSSWFFGVGAVIAAVTEQWLICVNLMLLFVVSRSMGRLLCGWVHTWTAHELHATREKLKER